MHLWVRERFQSFEGKESLKVYNILYLRYIYTFKYEVYRRKEREEEKIFFFLRDFNYTIDSYCTMQGAWYACKARGQTPWFG